MMRKNRIVSFFPHDTLTDRCRFLGISWGPCALDTCLSNNENRQG
jgi:hypothetical protein